MVDPKRVECPTYYAAGLLHLYAVPVVTEPAQGCERAVRGVTEMWSAVSRFEHQRKSATSSPTTVTPPMVVKYAVMENLPSTCCTLFVIVIDELWTL